ncbi:hypothetical protein VDGL01_02857 [Verticillium dahliae]
MADRWACYSGMASLARCSAGVTFEIAQQTSKETVLEGEADRQYRGNECFGDSVAAHATALIWQVVSGMLLCLVSKPSVAHTGHRMPFVAQRTRRLFLFGQASQVDALLTPRLASSRLNPNQVRQCAAPTETTKRPAWGENVRYLGTCGELGSTTYIAGYTWANVFLAWGLSSSHSVSEDSIYNRTSLIHVPNRAGERPIL